MGSLDRRLRGRTARGRLRLLDAYLCRAERALLTRAGGEWERAVFVDLGFGERPWTTLESARALRAINPGLRVVGVERDRARVEAAAAHEEGLTRFRQGGFALPLEPGETVRLIRAMNVLRSGYLPGAIPEIHQALGRALLPGGLLVEGSADAGGGVLGAHLLRRGPEALSREALLFATDFSHGFAPLLFRDWLPRDLRRRVHPGGPIHGFFAAWTEAWRQARAEGHLGPQEAFRRAALLLAERTGEIAAGEQVAGSGWLLWRPPGGVPA